jgi:hypothetical protein
LLLHPHLRVLLTLVIQVRLAVHEIYGGLFEGVAIELRKTLANIQANLVYQNLSNAEQTQINENAMAFFARRYTSFVAIVIASDTAATAANPRSLQIRPNEQIISQARRNHLLILPDNHILSTYTGSHQLRTHPDRPGEGFDFDAPLLRADPVLRAQYLTLNSRGEPNQNQAKVQLLTLNQQRYRALKTQVINGS